MTRKLITYDRRIRAACIALRLDVVPALPYKEIMRRVNAGELGDDIPPASPRRETIQRWVAEATRERALERARRGDVEAFADMGARLLDRLDKELREIEKTPVGKLSISKATALAKAIQEARKLTKREPTKAPIIEGDAETDDEPVGPDEAKLLAEIAAQV